MGKETLMDQAKRYAKKHIDKCESWTHGGIDDVWVDEHGTVCIQYEDGSWFHYKEEGGEVTYW